MDPETSWTMPEPVLYVIVMFLVCISGLFAGLTLGLLGLDVIGLEIIGGGDNDDLRDCARDILPIRRRGNLLLCTLLLGNVACNSLLSILMAHVTSGIVGFILSTVLIVLFGEIIPQAICARYALQIGRRSLPLVKVLICIFFVFSYPVSKILDLFLGEEIGTVHTRTELLTMLRIHERHQQLDNETVKFMTGAIRYQDKKVKEVMTPIEDVFMIPSSGKLNFKILSEVFRAGYSRIPVYGKDRHDIVGVLLAKDLILFNPKCETPIRNVVSILSRPFHIVKYDHTLGEVLKTLKQVRTHLAFVVNDNGFTPHGRRNVVGIVTIEDIIGEIIGIMHDETDMLFNEQDGEGAQSFMCRRDRELANLMILSGKVDQERLSDEEILAISSHFVHNVPQLKPLFDSYLGHPPSVDFVEDMIDKCRVMEPSRVSTSDMIDMNTPANEDILFRRGRMANACVLILSGKVAVLAGSEEFYSELGSWTLLGVDALYKAEGAYEPDFTAYIISPTARLLWISRHNMLELFEVCNSQTSHESFGSIPGKIRRTLKRLTANSAPNVVSAMMSYLQSPYSQLDASESGASESSGESGDSESELI
eukprot:CAMPEP_0185041306 /NCGR_PEP_ID=MMETSP1103-20130426/40396_1 /TAXON_ID=36769 /ORGANISM="Paraphysomonas bandaiensis, Strain Caron Lab Isolate" /LENGTH=591 /DNA_ID=CAMNT_0027580963 /DNA_START=116 /DNA_END=1891 /DNA_ORIENTATION=-